MSVVVVDGGGGGGGVVVVGGNVVIIVVLFVSKEIIERMLIRFSTIINSSISGTKYFYIK